MTLKENGLTPKQDATITFNPNVLEKVDDATKKGNFSSRSEFINTILIEYFAVRDLR